ncbi:hypothetical protein T265_01622 [Opisthorchis viverrini]|uniref:Uncharacterized protein n=1 Tax=Opisthorchis viverrini TaxID=6198 RepID=A0A075A1T4_OPIVI|nr:hypothetical protein T265_01622 [Opisthorchis viverrini]KER32187.1 hypothetical protein T265_01622 [Opisthorchis viverrini]
MVVEHGLFKRRHLAELSPGSILDYTMSPCLYVFDSVFRLMRSYVFCSTLSITAFMAIMAMISGDPSNLGDPRCPNSDEQALITELVYIRHQRPCSLQTSHTGKASLRKIGLALEHGYPVSHYLNNVCDDRREYKTTAESPIVYCQA